jgi:hypothetical protein
MSEERPTTRHGFLSRMFSGNADEEGTTVYSAEEVGAGETGRETMGSRGFTVERAADIIEHLPPEVPRPAAVRIVRGTLEAAGIDITELATSTRTRESKLTSEIELSQTRIQELKEKTEEVIRTYEDEIRNAREARDFGISEEERRISECRSSLEDVEKVRDFFALAGDDYATTGKLPDYAETGVPTEEDTQVMERASDEDTEILRRPGPLSEDYLNSEENRDR